MTLQEIESAAGDASISDEKFFETLLKYFNEQEAECKKSEDISLADFPSYKKMEAEMNHLRNLVERLRPAVMKMMERHVLNQHKDCCVPESRN